MKDKEQDETRLRTGQRGGRKSTGREEGKDKKHDIEGRGEEGEQETVKKVENTNSLDRKIK